MIRDNIRKFTSDADRQSMLASLSPPMACALIAEKLADQSTRWLQVAMLAGAFDVSEEVFCYSGGPCAKLDQVPEMLDAALAFLKGSSVSTFKEDPVFGTQRQGVDVITLRTDDDFQVAFNALTQHFIGDYQQTLAKLNSMGSKAVHHQLQEECEVLFAKLAVGAIALNLPRTLETILQTSPNAADVAVKANSIFGGHFFEKKELTSYGFSMLFSRTHCMDVVQRVALKQRIPLVGKALGLRGDYFDVCTAHENFDALRCFPSVYGKAMTDRFALQTMGPANKEKLVKQAIEALGVHEENSLATHIPAFKAAGLYDINPAQSFDAAVRVGCVEVINHFEGRVPWDNLARTIDPSQSILVDALCAYTKVDISERHEESLVRVIDMAIEDGRSELVFQISSEPDPGLKDGNASPVFVSPLSHLIEFKFSDVLMKFLNQGLDVNAPAAEGAWTPLQTADARSPEIAHVFRTFSARQKALEALQDIDAAPAFKIAAP